MNRRAFITLIPLIPAVAMLGCASPGAEKPTISGPVFDAAERAQITQHYVAERGRGPARTAPAQRVKPGDKLDTGQRPTRLPGALDDHLRHLPEPYARLVLGGDVILVNRNTHDIHDVIPQVAY
jgi:hypothetical protein